MIGPISIENEMILGESSFLKGLLLELFKDNRFHEQFPPYLRSYRSHHWLQSSQRRPVRVRGHVLSVIFKRNISHCTVWTVMARQSGAHIFSGSASRGPSRSRVLYDFVFGSPPAMVPYWHLNRSWRVVSVLQ